MNLLMVSKLLDIFTFLLCEKKKKNLILSSIETIDVSKLYVSYSLEIIVSDIEINNPKTHSIKKLKKS